MKPSERKVTFPVMGKQNSETIKMFLEELGLQVIMSPPITDETIRIGSRHCPNMVCFPLKTTLGNYVESIKKGANTLLSYDTNGDCRFRQYGHLHKFILNDLGYDFEMQILTAKNIITMLSRISGKNLLFVLMKLFKYYKKLKKNDSCLQEWKTDSINIGIIGEVYCCCEDKANFGLLEKIKNFGGNPFNTVTTVDFMENDIPLFNFFNIKNWFKKDGKSQFKKEAKNYLKGFTAGHCYENLYNLLWMKSKKIDGIIHLLPLCCMPETTIEPYVNKICKDANIPFLRITIDENSAEVNLDTRLETFIELIKIKKKS